MSAKIRTVCAQCGIVFYRYASQGKTGKGYCSRRCYGLSIRGKEAHNRILPPDEQVAKEYRDGLSAYEIAREYGVSESNARAAIKRTGTKMRNPSAAMKGKQPLLADLPMQEVVEAYDGGATIAELGNRYGVHYSTIANRLKDINYHLRDAGFGYSKLCSDGHRADSSLEYAVDEWLTEHGIEHDIHPLVPWHSHRRADFLVGKIYIEVWGVERNKEYEKRKAEKRANYRKHGYDLIELYPRQINQGNLSKLEALL